MQNRQRYPMLISMHEDVLPFGTQDERVPLGITNDETVQPTRTVTQNHYHITDQGCIIGRDQVCQIRVRHHRTDISRQHASIRYEDQQFVIYDHSRNGTYVNNQLVSGSCQLYHDDIIGLANSRQMLRFVHIATQLSNGPALTEREREVLRLVAAGKLNKEIAVDLLIAPNTVNAHLKSIYEKLDVHNRTEAINQARKLRLL